MDYFRDLTGEEFEDEVRGESEIKQRVGLLWRELRAKEFTQAEQILFGIRRGNVGLLVAETEIGKTTISLNLCLTLAANRIYPPFINERLGGLRIMYVDGEATQAEITEDINRMTGDWSKEEKRFLDENLLILCDEEVDDELLTLTNPDHFAVVMHRAQEFKADFIIIDTMSALFSLHDENGNAEIKRVVMQPLKKLAKEVNAALLLSHHSGKSRSEDGSRNANAYSGRGGSNFGCLARSVVVLTAPYKAERERIVLSVQKAKGYRLSDVVMRLDREKRWFKVTDETPPVTDKATCFSNVVAFITERGGAETEEIIAAFEGEFGKRTVEDALTEATRREKLHRPRRGRYEPHPSALPHSPIRRNGNAETVEGDGAAYKVDDVDIQAEGTM